MPRNNKHHGNHSNAQSYKHSVTHHENHEVLGQLNSINLAVVQIALLVEGLDQKIDSFQPGQVRAPEPPTANHPPVPPLDPDEHNYFARLHNSLAQDGDFVLMPLRDASNRLVSSFPRTLARLAFIYEDGELYEMLKSFGIAHSTFTAHQMFCEFVGVNFAFALQVMKTYSFLPTPSVTETRELRERLRASAIRYAVPPNRDSPRNIQRLNAQARVANRDSLFKLLPLRDVWGMVVPSFPTDLFQLFNPVYQMDIRFLLAEYGQSDAAEECERRWVEFVGVSWAAREYWLEDELVFHRYTAV